MKLNDLVTLTMAKAHSKCKVSPGGAGRIETKVVEILPPTECPLIEDETNAVRWYYDIPNSYNLDGDHDYYLYVDGKEFKYDYDPKIGSGWYKTDGVYDKFNSYYEYIIPGNIDTAPETVTASIKQVTKIVHHIGAEYLPDGFAGLPVRVNALETGGILVEKAEYDFERNNAIFTIPGVTSLFAPGLDMRVHFDGTDYDCSVMATGRTDFPYAFGNISYVNWEYEDTGEPFCCAVANYDELQGIAVVVNEEAATSTHTVEIRKYMPINPKQLPNGCVGYSEPNVITFDGDLTGRTLYGDFVKLSDEPVDLNSVTRVVFTVNPMAVESVGTSSLEYTPEMWTVRTNEFGQVLETDGTPILASLNIDSGDQDVGLWGLLEQDDIDGSGNPTLMVWASRIEYGENIHPIDPKYLVKTIELDKYGIGDAILALFAAGGGRQEVAGVGTFWDDVATSSVLRLVQPYDYLAFEVDQCVRTRPLNDYSRVDTLNFNFMAAMNSEKVYTLYVSINRVVTDGVPGAYVYMKVV